MTNFTILENRRSQVQSQAQPIFFPRNDDSHCDKIHSSLIAIHYFDSGCVGQQPVALKEYCAEYWLKELQERMDRCTGHCYTTEILLKMVLNTIGSTLGLLKPGIVLQWVSVHKFQNGLLNFFCIFYHQKN